MVVENVIRTTDPNDIFNDHAYQFRETMGKWHASMVFRRTTKANSAKVTMGPGPGPIVVTSKSRAFNL